MPVFIQNLAISAFGLYWYFRRFGGVFEQELIGCKKRQLYSKDEWKNWQEIEFRKLLLHSYRTVPYYKKMLNEKAINEETINNFSIEALKKIPILDKKTFRSLHHTELMSNTPEPNGTYIYTSGSTGTPLKIMYSTRMHQQYLAVYELYVRNWAGINNKMKRGVFGGRRILKDGNSKGPFYRYNYVEKQAYFSAYHISKQNVANYIEGIKKFKLDYLEGYSSSIYFLAKFAEDLNLKVPKLKAVLGSTDKLTVEMREAIQRVFQCEVFDSYNGVDLCNLISECPHHRLHLIPELGIVEVLNDKGEECKPGEVGELISTGLLNYDQPLIRYRIGDLVKVSENQDCPCGCKMLVVDEIVGRIEDVVIGADGREMRRFNRILIDIPGVIEGQIIQLSLTKFEIKIVAVEELRDADYTVIKSRMEAQLGEIELAVNIVDSIPRGPNGKFKSVISHINKNKV